MTMDQKRDWNTRDVMVGVLKNADQYHTNKEHGFYHMPAALLTHAPEDVRFLALYRSKKQFSDREAGIVEYGEVGGYRELPRGEITEIPARHNPAELYYRFYITEWKALKHPIRARGLAPGMNMFTTLFLLQNCRFFPELYISSEEHWRLYSLLRGAAVRTHRNGGSELLPSTKGHTVMVAGPAVGVYTAGGDYRQYDLRNFFREPYSFLTELEPCVSITD